jgi:hypothetical protein
MINSPANPCLPLSKDDFSFEQIHKPLRFLSYFSSIIPPFRRHAAVQTAAAQGLLFKLVADYPGCSR